MASFDKKVKDVFWTENRLDAPHHDVHLLVLPTSPDGTIFRRAAPLVHPLCVFAAQPDKVAPTLGGSPISVRRCFLPFSNRLPVAATQRAIPPLPIVARRQPLRRLLHRTRMGVHDNHAFSGLVHDFLTRHGHTALCEKEAGVRRCAGNGPHRGEGQHVCGLVLSARVGHHRRRYHLPLLGDQGRCAVCYALDRGVQHTASDRVRCKAELPTLRHRSRIRLLAVCDKHPIRGNVKLRILGKLRVLHLRDQQRIDLLYHAVAAAARTRAIHPPRLGAFPQERQRERVCVQRGRGSRKSGGDPCSARGELRRAGKRLRTLALDVLHEHSEVQRTAQAVQVGHLHRSRDGRVERDQLLVLHRAHPRLLLLPVEGERHQLCVPLVLPVLLRLPAACQALLEPARFVREPRRPCALPVAAQLVAGAVRRRQHRRGSHRAVALEEPVQGHDLPGADARVCPDPVAHPRPVQHLRRPEGPRGSVLHDFGRRAAQVHHEPEAVHAAAVQTLRGHAFRGGDLLRLAPVADNRGDRALHSAHVPADVQAVAGARESVHPHQLGHRRVQVRIPNQVADRLRQRPLPGHARQVPPALRRRSERVAGQTVRTLLPGRRDADHVGALLPRTLVDREDGGLEAEHVPHRRLLRREARLPPHAARRPHRRGVHGGRRELERVLVFDRPNYHLHAAQIQGHDRAGTRPDAALLRRPPEQLRVQPDVGGRDAPGLFPRHRVGRDPHLGAKQRRRQVRVRPLAARGVVLLRHALFAGQELLGALHEAQLRQVRERVHPPGEGADAQARGGAARGIRHGKTGAQRKRGAQVRRCRPRVRENQEEHVLRERPRRVVRRRALGRAHGPLGRHLAAHKQGARPALTHRTPPRVRQVVRLQRLLRAALPHLPDAFLHRAQRARVRLPRVRLPRGDTVLCPRALEARGGAEQATDLDMLRRAVALPGLPVRLRNGLAAAAARVPRGV